MALLMRDGGLALIAAAGLVVFGIAALLVTATLFV